MAFMAHTEHASLRRVGVFSSRLLLWGILFAVAIAAALVTVPPLQGSSVQRLPIA
jgi:hypothetical protein